MRKTTILAAIAATLALNLAPATATAPGLATPLAPTAGTTSGSPVALVSTPAAAMTPAATLQAALASSAALPRVTPGQELEDFTGWLSRSENRAEALAFIGHLEANGVGNVVPVWQLMRTSSSFRECGASGFEVAPRDKWDHIVTTLKFVQQDVVPAVGPVQVVSGYRNEQLNRCSAGAPRSAHRMFFALDMVPVNASVSRGDLVRGVCAAHARDGRGFNTGLGFYNGVRFHVDSNGFRKWGADGRGATSPCVSYS